MHDIAAALATLKESTDLHELLERNKQWACDEHIKERHRESTNFESQFHDSPSIFWLGCADSRVPPNEIVHLGTGEMSVHRNIANVVSVSDVNLLADLDVSITDGHVPTIIVCGHYNCGGVAAALSSAPHGLIDNWLLHIRQVASACRPVLDLIPDEAKRLRALVELNVIHGALTLSQTPIVRDAWKRGQDLAIHAWVFDIGTGQISDLGCTISSVDDADTLANFPPFSFSPAALQSALLAPPPHIKPMLPVYPVAHHHRKHFPRLHKRHASHASHLSTSASDADRHAHQHGSHLSGKHIAGTSDENATENEDGVPPHTSDDHYTDELHVYRPHQRPPLSWHAGLMRLHNQMGIMPNMSTDASIIRHPRHYRMDQQRTLSVDGSETQPAKLKKSVSTSRFWCLQPMWGHK